MSFKEGLVVTLPRFGSEHLVESFLRQKSSWILKYLHRLQKQSDKIILKHSTEEYMKHKDAFLSEIKKRVDFFNSLYGYRYGKISIRNQTSLWGSCTRQGNLQFNFKLSFLPKEAIDYVVVHELCHLREHNHGKKFWELVGKTVPNYKAIRKSLRGYIMQEG
jgi:predicted metal-dependent hydrolase